MNANGINNWSPVAFSSSPPSPPSRYESSSPSFAETLASAQPAEAEQQAQSSSDSASMLQQLRSQSSYRSTDSQNTSSSHDQVDQSREAHSGGVHHSGHDSRRQTTENTPNAKRSDAAEPRKEEREDEVHLTGEPGSEKAKSAKGSSDNTDASQAEEATVDSAEGSDAASSLSGNTEAPGTAPVKDKGTTSSKAGDNVQPQRNAAKSIEDQSTLTPGLSASKGKPKVQAGDAQPDTSANAQATPALDGRAGTNAQLVAGAAPSNAAAPAAAGVLTEATPSSVPVLSKGKNAGSSLAFALKINGANANASSSSTGAVHKGTGSPSDPPQAATPGISDSPFAEAMIRAQSKSGGKEPGEFSGTPDLKEGVAGASAFSLASTPDSATPTSSSTASSTLAAPVITEIADDKSAAAATVKNVQVQIMNADNERVDLRLVERAGALTISVRTGDSNLTKALQENLPSLSNKLSDQQVRAEWWTPENPKIEASAKTNQSNNEGRDQSGNSNQSGQQNNQSGQQGGRGARQQPDWMDELADSRKPNQNGTQYSWHL